jgi:hypothetical protein
MLENFNDIKAYKSIQKIRVIFFILLLILPFSYLLLYFDYTIIRILLNNDTEESLRHLFEFSWWRIAIFSFLQYAVFTVLWSIYYHTFKVILKNRDFFLS